MSVQGSPLFPLQPQELLSTSKSLLKSGFPISLTFLTDLIACFISFHFAGKQNIFTGYLFVYIFFLLPFIRSIDQGFAILASKLFGAKRYQELGTLYQRHLSIVTACSVPVILLMLFLGFGPLSSENEVIFLRSMIPSFIGTLIFSSTKHFLIAQNIFMTPAIITFGLIPIHALLCYIFVDLLGMHVSGIGFAKSITDVTAVVLLFSYIRYTGICRDTWIPWTQECLKNRELQLKRTWKLGTTNFVEFSVYEISFFLTFALRLFQDSVGFRVDEFVPYLAYALFCIPWGISLSMQATIGNMIVEGNKEKVKKILAGGIALNSLFSLISVLYIVIFRKQIASFFDTENETFENMLLIFAIALTFDSFSNIIGGVLKVLGKEKQVGLAFFVSFLSFPGQWIFGHVYGYGYMTIWLCLAVTAFLKCAWLICQVYILNWEEQIQKAKRALDEQASGETQSLIEFADMT